MQEVYQNNLVAMHQKYISYFPCYNGITGGIVSSILFGRLEYWFSRTNGEPFFKYLSPNVNSKEGDTWVEEVGITEDEFRTAFSKIAKVWKSKTEYENAEDKFCGFMYCSYIDKILHKTYYVRNNQKVEENLKKLLDLVCQNENTNLPKWKIQSPEMENPVSANGKSNLDTIQEKTSRKDIILPKKEFSDVCEKSFNGEEEEKEIEQQQEPTLIPNRKGEILDLKARLAKIDPTVSFGENYKADHDKAKKRLSQSGWQLVYKDLLVWFEFDLPLILQGYTKEGIEIMKKFYYLYENASEEERKAFNNPDIVKGYDLVKKYRNEVIGWTKQYSHLKQIRELDCLEGADYERFKFEVKSKMEELAEQDWHKGRFDFGTLCSVWHKLGEPLKEQSDSKDK